MSVEVRFWYMNRVVIATSRKLFTSLEGAFVWGPFGITSSLPYCFSYPRGSLFTQTGNTNDNGIPNTDAGYLYRTGLVSIKHGHY